MKVTVAVSALPLQSVHQGYSNYGPLAILELSLCYYFIIVITFCARRLFMLSYERREISLVGEKQPPLYHFMKINPTVT